jgi:hypothetical protein
VIAQISTRYPQNTKKACQHLDNSVITSWPRASKAENCALLGYYAASGVDFLSMFRNNLSPFSGVKNPKMGSIDCPETSVRNYHCSLRNNPEKRSSHLLKSASTDSWTIWSRDIYLAPTGKRTAVDRSSIP